MLLLDRMQRTAALPSLPGPSNKTCLARYAAPKQSGGALDSVRGIHSSEFYGACRRCISAGPWMRLHFALLFHMEWTMDSGMLLLDIFFFLFDEIGM